MRLERLGDLLGVVAGAAIPIVLIALLGMSLNSRDEGRVTGQSKLMGAESVPAEHVEKGVRSERAVREPRRQDEPARETSWSVDYLRAQCVNDARSANRAAAGGGSVWCNRFARASKATLPEADSPPAMPTVPAATLEAPLGAPTAAYVVPRVVPSECSQFRYGSLKRRKCRSVEKKRLAASCAEAGERVRSARGEEVVRLREWESAWCIAAANYQPIE